MSKEIHVQFSLTADTPNTISFEDTYDGLENPWYKFETDVSGGVTLWANQEGFEHLARYFLKLARSDKRPGFHCHNALEFGDDSNGPPEFTVSICEAPPEDET